MTEVTRLPNGNLLVPLQVSLPGGGYALGMTEVGPDDPSYEQWLPWVVDGDSPPRPLG